MGSTFRRCFRAFISKWALLVFNVSILCSSSVFAALDWNYSPVEEVRNTCYASFRSDQAVGKELVDQIFLPSTTNEVKHIPLYGYSRKDLYDLGVTSTQLYLNQALYNFHVFKKIFNRSDRISENFSKDANHQLQDAIKISTDIFEEQKDSIRTLATSKDLQAEVDVVNQWNGQINQICRKRNQTFAKLMKAYQNPSYQNPLLTPDIQTLLYPDGKKLNSIESINTQTLLKRRLDEQREYGAIETSLYRTLVANSSLAFLLETKTDLQDQVGIFSPLGCVENGNQLKMIPNLDAIPNSIKQVNQKYESTIKKLAPPRTFLYFVSGFFGDTPIENTIEDYIQENPIAIRNTLLVNPDQNQAKAVCGAIHKIQSKQDAKQVFLPIFMMGGTVITAAASPAAAPLLGFLFGIFNVEIALSDISHSQTMEKGIEHAMLSGQIRSLQGQEVIRNLREARPLSYVNLALSVAGTAFSATKIAQMNNWNGQIAKFGGSSTTFDSGEWESLWKNNYTPIKPLPSSSNFSKSMGTSKTTTRIQQQNPATLATASSGVFQNQKMLPQTFANIQHQNLPAYFSSGQFTVRDNIEFNSEKRNDQTKIEEYKTKLDKAIMMISRNEILSADLTEQVCFLLKFGPDSIKKKILKNYPALQCETNGNHFSFNIKGFSNSNASMYNDIFNDPEYSFMLRAPNKSEKKISQIAAVYNKIWFVDDLRSEEKPLMNEVKSFVLKNSFHVQVYSEKNTFEYEKILTPTKGTITLKKTPSKNSTLDENIELLPFWMSLKIDLEGGLYLLCKNKEGKIFLLRFDRPEILKSLQQSIVVAAIKSNNIDRNITRYVYGWAADLYWNENKRRSMDELQVSIWKLIYSVYQFKYFYMVTGRTISERDDFVFKMEEILDENLRELGFWDSQIDGIISMMKILRVFNNDYTIKKDQKIEEVDAESLNQELSDLIQNILIANPDLLTNKDDEYDFGKYLHLYTTIATRFWRELFEQKASIKEKIQYLQIIRRLATDKPIRLWHFFMTMAQEAFSDDVLATLKKFIDSGGEIVETKAEKADREHALELFKHSSLATPAVQLLVKKILGKIILPVEGDSDDRFNFVFPGEIAQIDATKYLVMDLHPYPQNFAIDVSMARLVGKDLQIIWIPATNLENGQPDLFEMNVRLKTFSRVTFLTPEHNTMMSEPIFQKYRTVVATGEQFSIEPLRDSQTKKFPIITLKNNISTFKEFDSTLVDYMSKNGGDKYVYIFVDTYVIPVDESAMVAKHFEIMKGSKFEVIDERKDNRFHYIVLQETNPFTREWYLKQKN